MIRAVRLGVPLLLVVGAAGVASAATAQAGEQPFTVTAEGVSLPAGETFPDGGHVNVIATAPHNDLHFEAKCIDRVDAECAALHDAAQFIGQSFIPWSVFGLTDGCVSWVQVAGINKHFGDAGEAPICLGGTPSTPVPSVTPGSTPTPTPATPAPTSSASPTSEPNSSPSPTLPDVSTVTPPRTLESLSAPSQASAAPARLADTGRTYTVWDLAAVLFATCAIGLGVFSIARRNA